MRKGLSIIPALFAFVALVAAQSGNDLFQQALQKERADGDIGGAIKIYEQILTKFGSDRALTAKALFQLGVNYERLGQAKSQEYFQQIVSKYSDQADVATEAKSRLKESAATTAHIETPYTKDPYSFAISPDGRRVVYQATVGGKNQLWLRNLDTRTAAPIAGTEGSEGWSAPFWSPDGKSIGFFAETKLKRVDLPAGPVKVLADAPWPRGGSWSGDGIILFAPFNIAPLYTVPAGGGTPTAVTLADGTRQQFPQFLPDNRHFLFLGDRNWLVGTLGTPTTRPLPATGGEGRPDVVFAPPNRLLVGRPDGSKIDAGLLNMVTLEGGPRIKIAGPLSGEVLAGKGAFSVSSRNLAYRTATAIQRRLIWYSRQGGQLSSFDLPQGTGEDIRISPDGKAAIFRATGLRDSWWSKQLWIMDLTANAFRQLPSPQTSAGTWAPVWSPDGTQVGTTKGQGSYYNLFVQDLNGENVVAAFRSPEAKFLRDWSSTGVLLYEKFSPRGTGADLFAIPIGGDDPIPIAATAAMESAGRFSPDGRWIAYQSNEEGRNEVFVQPFAGSHASRLRVSVSGGTAPEWRRDGREIFFLSNENQLMAVSVSYDSTSGAVQLGKPAVVFSSPLPDGSTYAPALDGQRFLVNAPLGAVPPILIVSNWAPPSFPPAPIGNVPTLTTYSAEQTQIVVFDRQGNRLGVAGSPGLGGSLAMSPDGNRVALIRNTALTTIDIGTNVPIKIAERVTDYPVWSPDGSRLAYTVAGGLYLRNADGTGPERLVHPLVNRTFQWTSDGRFLAGVINENNFVLLPLNAERKEPITIMSRAEAPTIRLSPDGRFVAFSDPGSSYVWVQTIPGPAGNRPFQQWIVSTGRGGAARWRSDGKELYYLTPDGEVMAVPITTSPEFKSGAPALLFRVPPGFPVANIGDIRTDGMFDVSGDGQRFVFLLPAPLSGSDRK